jgi:phosphatidylglycerophosphatase A
METAALGEAMLGILGLSDAEVVPAAVVIAVVILFLFGAYRVLLFVRVLLFPFARGLKQGIKEFQRAFRESGHGIGKSLGAGLGKPVADALTHSNQTWEFQDPPALRLRKIRKQVKVQFILFIAQGFGVGRIPLAPGTFGSLVGLLWFTVLLLAGNPWVALSGMLAAILLSVWLCGAAERILNRTDPGSVVLDEIVAVPLCFAVWVGAYAWRQGALPAPGFFFSRDNWPLTLAVFAAFRFFDVLKPWPVRQSQRLPGGWGVTMDDVLAAFYVNLLAALTLLLPSSP